MEWNGGIFLNGRTYSISFLKNHFIFIQGILYMENNILHFLYYILRKYLIVVGKESRWYIVIND